MGLFSNNNNQDVLDKLRQVLNEVLELKAEESARSKEMIKQMDALNKKVQWVSEQFEKVNKGLTLNWGLLHGLHHKVGFCKKEGTLEDLIKDCARYLFDNCVTKTMMEMLGKKVNEIGKTVDDHFESFVKVSEKNTELFKLIAQALTGKMVEEEASAEPKLTEKAKKNERRKTKKNEGAKEAASEAEKTVSGTDGNGGKERKTVVIEGKIGIDDEKSVFAFSKEIGEFLYRNGFKYIPYPKGGFKELSFRKTMRKGEKGTDFAILNEDVIHDAHLAKRLYERFGFSFACVLRCNSHYCKLSFKK